MPEPLNPIEVQNDAFRASLKKRVVETLQNDGHDSDSRNVLRLLREKVGEIGIQRDRQGEISLLLQLGSTVELASLPMEYTTFVHRVESLLGERILNGNVVNTVRIDLPDNVDMAVLSVTTRATKFKHLLPSQD